jgi:hypothetical protein
MTTAPPERRSPLVPAGLRSSKYLSAELPPDELAPVLGFPLFYDRVFDWEQDQHIAIIGPTEQGKSNLAKWLLRRRGYVAYLCIKSEDETLDGFRREGWIRTEDWPPRRDRRPRKPLTWPEAPRRLVWPNASDRRTARVEQQRVFGACLDDIWSTGRACVVWDDFWYIVRILGMELDAKQNLLNARSAKSSQVIISQRAGGNRMVELTDQPTHLFWAREKDPRNLVIVGPANSVRRGFVENLDRYQFLYENTRTGVRYRITAPPPEATP